MYDEYGKPIKKETQYTLLHGVRARVYKGFRGRATVYFPIWWYVAPTIINSFLEGYDFNGKTVIPLATSGGSGMGRTSRELVLSCPGAILKEGKVFSANTEKNRLAEWAAGITGEGNIKAQEKVREEYKKRQEALKKQQKETAPADASKRTGS